MDAATWAFMGSVGYGPSACAQSISRCRWSRRTASSSRRRSTETAAKCVANRALRSGPRGRARHRARRWHDARAGQREARLGPLCQRTRHAAERDIPEEGKALFPPMAGTVDHRFAEPKERFASTAPAAARRNNPCTVVTGEQNPAGGLFSARRGHRVFRSAYARATCRGSRKSDRYRLGEHEAWTASVCRHGIGAYFRRSSGLPWRQRRRQ